MTWQVQAVQQLLIGKTHNDKVMGRPTCAVNMCVKRVRIQGEAGNYRSHTRTLHTMMGGSSSMDRRFAVLRLLRVPVVVGGAMPFGAMPFHVIRHRRPNVATMRWTPPVGIGSANGIEGLCILTVEGPALRKSNCGGRAQDLATSPDNILM